jgi:hypothetical protein
MSDSSSSQPPEFTFQEDQHSFHAQIPDEVDSLLDIQSLLLEQAREGDSSALQQVLNLKLAPYQARVEDIGARKEHLQISVSGREVPNQERLEPLLQTWIVQLGLFKFSTIELYGQKDGSALPFWRCAFNPKEIDLDALAVLDASEVAATLPTEFIDPLQVEFKREVVNPVLDDPWDASALEGGPTDPLPEVSELVSFALDDAFDLDFGDGAGDISSQSQSQPSSDAVSQEQTKDVKDFLARYAAGERNFTKINLNEADLSRVNLTLANLHGAELVWTNLTEANLYHIDLSSAKLRHANLRGAMLRSSNLQGTDFLNANLRGADLSWSNLNGANLTGADLTDANLKNAILERVILPDGTFLD